MNSPEFDDTQMGSNNAQNQDELKNRAVELGFLKEQEAEEVFRDYADNHSKLNFGSFLLQKGLVSVEQLADLCDEEESDETVVQPADEAAPAPAAGGLGISQPQPKPKQTHRIGDIYSGCRIIKKLGAGGMGTVYIGEKIADGAQVVIKFLASQQAHNPVWRARFVREAEMMRNLSHPNIVELFAVDGESAQPHIVMEFVDGFELGDLVSKGKKVEQMRAARLLRDLAAALAKAHSAGVVHRDIKPANVLVTKTDCVKLLDFGLAKSTALEDGLSMAGQIMGTPHYMAPEQWGDHEVDERCDIFSVGATLYHLVTGQVPFAGAKQRAIAQRAVRGEFPRPTALVPDLNEDLELVIMRLLEPDRRFRYPTCDLVVADLTALIEGREVNVPRLVETTGSRRGMRYPLLPGDKFTIGRESSNSVAIPDSSVSRQHAVIERSKLGYLLRDLGSSYGTFVDEMRIREVVLKPGDTIKFGKTQFTFHDGGLEKIRTVQRQTRRLEKKLAKTDYVLDTVISGMISLNDRRTVMHLVRELAPKTQRREIEMCWQLTRSIFGKTTADTVSNIQKDVVKARLFQVSQRLFATTRENLGENVQAWLGWWDQMRARYPAQVTTQPIGRTRSVLRVVRGENEPRVIQLSDLVNEFPIGREEKCEIQINNRSVSRLHSTLIRFLTRFVVRDEGSRFGTQLNGNSVKLAFLNSGDQITLGKARLVFEESLEGSLADLEDKGVTSVPATLFEALVTINHPGTALALAQIAQIDEQTDWLVDEVNKLETDPKRREKLLSKTCQQYKAVCKRVQEKLSSMLEKEIGADRTTWVEQVEQHRTNLPPQVRPLNWFPVNTDRN